jgi:hypothetical protein
METSQLLPRRPPDFRFCFQLKPVIDKCVNLTAFGSRFFTISLVEKPAINLVYDLHWISVRIWFHQAIFASGLWMTAAAAA